ncbi:hypothetical protein DFS33DRAFT_1116863 [Desarmillaria ectypa]|nr:hypothetical protein DFS33DRAFT_1116863 [Desarmillaria ectypa]
MIRRALVRKRVRETAEICIRASEGHTWGCRTKNEPAVQPPEREVAILIHCSNVAAGIIGLVEQRRLRVISTEHLISVTLCAVWTSVTAAAFVVVLIVLIVILFRKLDGCRAERPLNTERPSLGFFFLDVLMSSYFGGPFL